MRCALVVPSCALALVSSLALSACGGDSRPYDKVPTTTPALVPPVDANTLAGSGSGTGTSATTTTPTTTTSTGTTGGASSGTSGTTTPSTGGTAAPTGGTTTPPGTGGTGGTQTSTQNPGGATPDQNAGAGAFSKFCQDNPGAC